MPFYSCWFLGFVFRLKRLIVSFSLQTKLSYTYPIILISHLQQWLTQNAKYLNFQFKFLYDARWHFAFFDCQLTDSPLIDGCAGNKLFLPLQTLQLNVTVVTINVHLYSFFYIISSNISPFFIVFLSRVIRRYRSSVILSACYYFCFIMDARHTRFEFHNFSTILRLTVDRTFKLTTLRHNYWKVITDKSDYSVIITNYVI